jgi:hypothetical protein
MPPVGFEPVIPASGRPKTYALDRAATAGTGDGKIIFCNNYFSLLSVVQQPNSGLSRLIVEVCRSYTIRHIRRCSQCMFPLNPHAWTAVVDLGLLSDIPRSHSFGLTIPRRTPLDEGSTRRTDLCLTIHNTHERQMSLPSAGFDPAIPAINRPQTHIVDLAATNNYLD